MLKALGLFSYQITVYFIDSSFANEVYLYVKQKFSFKTLLFTGFKRKLRLMHRSKTYFCLTIWSLPPNIQTMFYLITEQDF